MVTIAAALGAFAIFRALMPVVNEGAASIAPSGDGANAEFTQVLSLSEMATPDDVTVDLWAKNVGSTEISGVERMAVAFGSDQNPRPYPYGGHACGAPCWEYDLPAAGAWSPGQTLHVRIHLDTPVVASSWYRAALRGSTGGDATKLFRVSPGLASSTPTPVSTATPTSTPTP